MGKNNIKMKNILITGGAGFIGSNLALKLIEKGYNITVLDNLSPQIHGNNPTETSPLYLSIKDKVKFIHGSVTNQDDWKLALEGQDAIVHYAAETGTGQSMYEVKKYIDVNIGGTAIMLDLLVNSDHNIKKVVVASSRSIYGEGKYISPEFGDVYPTQRTTEDMDKGDFEVKYPGSSALALVGTDENSKIHPSSVYGISKQNQEQMELIYLRMARKHVILCLLMMLSMPQYWVWKKKLRIIKCSMWVQECLLMYLPLRMN